MSKRILIIAAFTETFVQFRGAFVKKLLKENFTVSVAIPVSQTPFDALKFFKDNDIIVYDAPIKRSTFSVFGDLNYFFNLLKIFATNKFEYVFSYGVKPIVFGTIAAKLFSIKNKIILFTGLGYVFINRKKTILISLAEWLVIFAVKQSDKVLFQNKEDCKEIMSYSNNFNKNKFRTVNGSGINLQEYKFNELEETEIISFIMISRFLKEKGLFEYIEASKKILKKHRKVKISLAGWVDDNPAAIDKDSLIAKIERAGINFLGKIKNVKDCIKDNSVIVLPSYREGTPRICLEAMAIGRPIITTNAPGCRQLINGKNGFLSEPKSAQSLFEQMEKAINEKDKLIEMGVQSRLIVEKKYSDKDVANDMYNFII